MPPLLTAADLGYEPMEGKASATQVIPVRRRVRFAEERNTVLEFEAVDNEDEELVRKLWHQPEDMQECKQALKLRARRWRQTGLGILLNSTFQDPNPLLCQKCLNAFAQLPEDLYNRGIERYLSKLHDMQRTTRKRSNLKDVLAHARSLDAVSNMPLEEKQNVLALFARHLNRDAELFARRIAKADEIAVTEGDDPSGADIMFNYLKHLEREKKMEQQQKRMMQQQMQQQQQNHQQQGAKAITGKYGGPTHHPTEADKVLLHSKPIPSIQDMRYQARQA